MSEYRVLERDGKFYPQYRGLLWWCNFKEDCSINRVEQYDEYFYSLSEATNYIKRRMGGREEENIKIHEVDL